jgi:hypothetical protein
VSSPDEEPLFAAEKQIVESFAGAIFCTLICVMVMFMALLAFGEAEEGPVFCTLISLAAVGDVWVLWLVWRHVRWQEHPVPPRVAMALPDWLPRPVGYVFGLFWLAHVPLCIFAGLAGGPETETFGEAVASMVASWFWSTGVSYVTNIFLLLSAYALARRVDPVAWIWARRWRISASIGAGCTAVEMLFGDALDTFFG